MKKLNQKRDAAIARAKALVAAQVRIDEEEIRKTEEEARAKEVAKLKQEEEDRAKEVARQQKEEEARL